MRVFKMRKEDLREYLESLKKVGELWAPVRKGDKFVYDKIDDVDKVELKALRTILPPKKFFIPQRNTVLKYRLNNEYSDPVEEVPFRILFGLHPCDINGLLILDRIYLERFPDPLYKKRRENTAIIGLSCVPDEKCLGKSTNTHYVEEGFDIALTDLDDKYLVWVSSSLGDDLVRYRIDLFDENITEDDMKQYVSWRNWRDSQYKLYYDLTGMPDIMVLSWDSPLWEELADDCLSCGMCSMVCPTCPCYNVKDITELSSDEGERIRYWDSCMYREFALVAGGHNFREARAERIKLWYTHKLKSFGHEFGKPACVGCGRCIDTCPADINVARVIKALKGEEVKV